MTGQIIKTKKAILNIERVGDRLKLSDNIPSHRTTQSWLTKAFQSLAEIERTYIKYGHWVTNRLVNL